MRRRNFRGQIVMGGDEKIRKRQHKEKKAIWKLKGIDTVSEITIGRQ